MNLLTFRNNKYYLKRYLKDPEYLKNMLLQNKGKKFKSIFKKETYLLKNLKDKYNAR